MTVTPQVVVKHCADRVEPRAEPKPARRESALQYLPGSVNLERLGNDPTWGPKAARIQDICRTLDDLSETIIQAIAQTGGELGHEVDDLVATVADLGRRLERAEAANAALAERNAGLTREFELMQRLDRDRRASVAAKPKAKRKPRGSTVEAAPGAEAAA